MLGGGKAALLRFSNVTRHTRASCQLRSQSAPPTQIDSLSSDRRSGVSSPGSLPLCNPFQISAS